MLGRILAVGQLLILQLLWCLARLVRRTKLVDQVSRPPVPARPFCRHVAGADGHQKRLCLQTSVPVGLCKAGSIWLRSAGSLAERELVVGSLVSALEVVQSGCQRSEGRQRRFG